MYLKIWSEKEIYLLNESPLQYTEKDINYWYITSSHTYNHHREGLHNNQQLV